MIPFLAPLALKMAPVGAFLKSIPRGVWIAIAIAAVVGIAIWWHRDKVKDAHKEGYTAGVAYEQARLEKKAKELKAKVDALSGKITANLRTKHDEKVVIITRAADDLRVRGPGKAACPRVAGVPSGSGGSIPSGGRTDAPATGLSDQDWIALPFYWTVNQAERCDLNRSEVLAWREWHRQQSEAWAKAR